MNFFKKYTTPFGYVADGNMVDAYGVDHSAFSTRDELEYQFARTKRENQLANSLGQQGIERQDYPRLGTAFWGNSPENNYGFGSSNISANIENMKNKTPAPWARRVSVFNQTPLNNKDNIFMTPWDKSQYQSNSNQEQTMPQTFQTPLPDMSKPFTPYPLKQSNITLFSEGYKNHPEWYEEPKQELPEEEKKPKFSENELMDRMLPVIKDMENPLDYIYIDTTWNKTTGAGTNVDDWDTFNKINWQMNGRSATEAEKRAAFNAFQKEIIQGRQNKDANGKIIKNNKKASYYDDYSSIRLAQGEIERLLRNHIAADIKYLRKEFPDFDTYPPELQNVLLDIKYNTGNVSAENWPNLRKAIAEKNLSGDKGILNNVHRKDVGEDRNSWAEQQIRNIKSW